MAKKTALGFEEGLERLEELVTRLERGGLTLEESIAAYEQGVELSGALEKLLESGKRRVAKLTESGEQPLEDAQ